MPADTTVPVSDEVWRELMLRKTRGDTFDDVLRRELGLDTDRDERDDAERDDPSADDDAIAAWTPPDELEVNTENARDALRAAVAWLRETEGAHRKGEIVAGAYRDGPLSERIWWTRAVRPGLLALDGVAVEGRKYRWAGGCDTD